MASLRPHPLIRPAPPTHQSVTPPATLHLTPVLAPTLSSRPAFCHLPLRLHARPIFSTRTARQSPAVPSASAMPAPPAPVPEHLVQFAHRLADAAREVVPPFFRQPIGIELKADESPVTAADRAAEAAITALIRAEYPAHGILGEEQGLQGPVRAGDAGEGAAGGEGEGGWESECEWVWVIDPIDGTASFITGKPLFGTLVALLHRGRPVLGVLEQPVLRERWVGVAGRPTTFNGVPVATRRCADLRDAYVYTTSPDLFPGASGEGVPRGEESGARKGELTGATANAFGLLSSGFVDVARSSASSPGTTSLVRPHCGGRGRAHDRLARARAAAGVAARGGTGSSRQSLSKLSRNGLRMQPRALLPHSPRPLSAFSPLTHPLLTRVSAAPRRNISPRAQQSGPSTPPRADAPRPAQATMADGTEFVRAHLLRLKAYTPSCRSKVRPCRLPGAHIRPTQVRPSALPGAPRRHAAIAEEKTLWSMACRHQNSPVFEKAWRGAASPRISPIFRPAPCTALHCPPCLPHSISLSPSRSPPPTVSARSPLSLPSFPAPLTCLVLSAQLGRAPEDIVKLDANENPYGPPPEVRCCPGGGEECRGGGECRGQEEWVGASGECRGAVSSEGGDGVVARAVHVRGCSSTTRASSLPSSTSSCGNPAPRPSPLSPRPCPSTSPSPLLPPAPALLSRSLPPPSHECIVTGHAFGLKSGTMCTPACAPLACAPLACAPLACAPPGMCTPGPPPLCRLPLARLPCAAFPCAAFPCAAFPCAAFPCAAFPCAAFPCAAFTLCRFPCAASPVPPSPVPLFLPSRVCCAVYARLCCGLDGERGRCGVGAGMEAIVDCHSIAAYPLLFPPLAAPILLHPLVCSNLPLPHALFAQPPPVLSSAAAQRLLNRRGGRGGAVESHRPKLLFLTSPNNHRRQVRCSLSAQMAFVPMLSPLPPSPLPTSHTRTNRHVCNPSRLISPPLPPSLPPHRAQHVEWEDLQQLLRLPVLWCWTRAYIEFQRPHPPAMPLVQRHANLIVLTHLQQARRSAPPPPPLASVPLPLLAASHCCLLSNSPLARLMPCSSAPLLASCRAPLPHCAAWGRAGLAGLRVGYGAFPLPLVEYLWRAKQPYNVSVAAEVAACAGALQPALPAGMSCFR
ncbi:unnamed protein product [Closterium sp. Naga37s-1]|nr:unnamed protein product [Closterium sp. Naga37s-1]